MAAVDYSANDIFLRDAAFVFASAARRDELVGTVRALVGRGTRKRVPYEQLEKFFDDYELRYSGDLPHSWLKLDYVLKEVRRGMDWPIPSLLAWLCYYHREKGAIPYYEKSQLKAEFGIECRTYVGEPGDRAKARLGIVVSTRSGTTDSASGSVAAPLPRTSSAGHRSESAIRLRLSPPRNSSSEFHYSRSMVEVRGRENEQDTLRRFVSGGPGFRWVQLAGAAGQGKSRLAHELTLELGAEWERGILRKRDLDAFKTHWENWNPKAPYLIVIDYVLGFEVEIGDAMRVLAARTREFDQPVRVLILERQPWDRGGLFESTSENGNPENVATPTLQLSIGRAEWFDKLNGSIGENDLAHEDYRFGTGVIPLLELAGNDLVKIVRQVAKARGLPLRHSDDALKRSLAKIDRSGRPLYSYFLADALLDESFDLDWCNSDLLRFVLDEERKKRWIPIFGDNAPVLGDDHPALRIALLASMIQSVECGELVRQLGWPPADSATRRQALVLSGGRVGGGVLGPKAAISAMEPDILAEWFVLSAFKNTIVLEELTHAAWSMAPSEMGSFLLRLVQDFPTHDALPILLDQVPPTDKAQLAYSAIATALAQHFPAERSFPRQLKRSLECAAEAGDSNAMLRLGYSYLLGKGVEQEPFQAIHWIVRASDSGNPKVKPYLEHFESIGVFDFFPRTALKPKRRNFLRQLLRKAGRPEEDRS